LAKQRTSDAVRAAGAADATDEPRQGSKNFEVQQSVMYCGNYAADTVRYIGAVRYWRCRGAILLIIELARYMEDEDEDDAGEVAQIFTALAEEHSANAALRCTGDGTDRLGKLLDVDFIAKPLVLKSSYRLEIKKIFRKMSHVRHCLHVLLPKQRHNKILNYPRSRGHNYVLPQIELTVFKNSFLNICLFSYI